MLDSVTPKQRDNLNRRDFLRLSGLTTLGVLATACASAPPVAPGADAASPASAPGDAVAEVTDASLGEVARERTLILMWSGTDGQFTDVGLANAYAAGGQGGHRAVMGSFEPLFYYSAFADEVVPWLAEDASYNDDFTELTVNIREGVTWSDGEPFTAGDVAFTLNMLKENAPELRNSSEVNEWVESAEAVDDLTAVIRFFEPRPRFLFSHLYGKFDTGIWWVPQHIFQDVEDIPGFAHYDLDAGLPVVTGPFNVVSWTPQQQIMDRRDDWWAVDAGFAELPQIERIIKIPATGEERAAQLVINNEIDSSIGMRATTIPQAVNGNPSIITHTLRDLPLGYIDWWPTSFWFNCAEPPFDSADVRWAVSYTIDRQQMLDVALEGSGILTQLPFPAYPAAPALLRRGGSAARSVPNQRAQFGQGRRAPPSRGLHARRRLLDEGRRTAGGRHLRADQYERHRPRAGRTAAARRLPSRFHHARRCGHQARRRHGQAQPLWPRRHDRRSL